MFQDLQDTWFGDWTLTPRRVLQRNNSDRSRLTDLADQA